MQVLRRPTEFAGQEEARAGGLGGLSDGHLRVDGNQADRGDDDVRADEHGRESRYVGVLGGGDVDAARGEGFVLFLVVRALRLVCG